MRLGAGSGIGKDLVTLALAICLAVLFDERAQAAGATTPTGQASPQPSNQAILSWDPDQAVAGYKVHIGTASHTYGAPVDVGTNTSYTFKNLTPRTTYHFAVKSYTAAGAESDFSVEVTKTISQGARNRFGDFDGDGRTDLAVFRPWKGDWMILQSRTGLQTTTHWGGWDDVPVPGDYDGDGKTDLAIWRRGTGDWWVLYNGATEYVKQNWGMGSLGDIPVPGDYDNDGKTDLAVWRKGDGTWRISYSGGGVLVQQWGVFEDVKLGTYLNGAIGGLPGDPNCSDGQGTSGQALACPTSFTDTGISLRVNGAGAGRGFVSSTPAGINCGGTCMAGFAPNAQVQLTTVADPGSTFAGWSGDSDCSDGLVTLNQAKTCTATFNLIAPSP